MPFSKDATDSFIESKDKRVRYLLDSVARLFGFRGDNRLAALSSQCPGLSASETVALSQRLLQLGPAVTENICSLIHDTVTEGQINELKKTYPEIFGRIYSKNMAMVSKALVNSTTPAAAVFLVYNFRKILHAEVLQEIEPASSLVDQSPFIYAMQ